MCCIAQNEWSIVLYRTFPTWHCYSDQLRLQLLKTIIIVGCIFFSVDITISLNSCLVSRDIRSTMTPTFRTQHNPHLTIHLIHKPYTVQLMSIYRTTRSMSPQLIHPHDDFELHNDKLSTSLSNMPLADNKSSTLTEIRWHHVQNYHSIEVTHTTIISLSTPNHDRYFYFIFISLYSHYIPIYPHAPPVFHIGYQYIPNAKHDSILLQYIRSLEGIIGSKSLNSIIVSGNSRTTVRNRIYKILRYGTTLPLSSRGNVRSKFTLKQTYFQYRPFKEKLQSGGLQSPCNHQWVWQKNYFRLFLRLRVVQ